MSRKIVLFVFSLLIILPASIAHLNNTNTRVVIVGGGAAGIAAASRLMFYYNYTNVKILEAENRIGGRIYSQEINQNFVELGPEWILNENRNNIIGSIVQQHKLWKYCPIPVASINSTLNGSIILISPSPTDFLSISRRYIFDEVPNEFFSEYLRNRKIINENKYNKCLYDTQSRTVSSYNYLLDILLEKHSNSLRDERVEILLNNEVQRILWAGPEVFINLVDGSQVMADKVIVTVPLGVLKNNFKYYTLFEPKLPEYKQDAIKNLKVTTVNKILIQFDKRWWPENFGGYAMMWNEKDYVENFQGDREWLRGVAGILPAESHPNFLVAWVFGRYAEKYEELSDDNVRNNLAELLHQLVNGMFQLPDTFYIVRTKWHSEPNFQGSLTLLQGGEYSHIDMDYLAEPMRNYIGDYSLFFAGEATNSENPGTVQGAIESGYRAADEVFENRYLYCVNQIEDGQLIKKCI